ncbi:RAMP superfamily CRISPR-associated protein [Desulfobulbus elongatus]|uniref:RAMP superfamily CRISPR-associated protein n=1 Tax=Desulfobulbus elongatus TaxID=53332 RepID=UPI00048393E3|nr:RAMP superfamily CRISPR-associated protein [Desulfobulbus elongatus]
MIITRYYNTTTLHLTVEFLTPTFLGGADQNAELRTAPFKNLLRQWWRVAVGSKKKDVKEMLTAEGDLFGSVLDDSKASASRVRLMLTPVEGDFSFSGQEVDFGKTSHPEVKGGMKVSNALYLGFGPITYKGGQTETKRYIAPGSKAKLDISFPKLNEADLREILEYVDAFGTFGSRSRNGWGSVSFSGDVFQRKDTRAFAAVAVSRLLDPEQGKPYPASLGSDGEGILCWETHPLGNDWKTTMKTLAEMYMNLRTGINIKPQGLQERHILGYPVTNHAVSDRDWGGNEGRMPSQLRLMVKRNLNDQLVGRILHLPHKLPKKWNNGLGQELDIWKKIHARLDANKQFHRCGGAQ